uniref:Reverse transcriptase domain-containing protein n=1 Tax=Xenopus tropicalis TaxID=8364 RepID=A0A803J2B7_XENTR
MNNIFDPLQSGFKKHHSCETALVQICNDLLMARDRGECSILILLDLSTAFDTVDHEILLNRLQEYCGIDGLVLQWFSSFLAGRTQRVALGPFQSNPVPLKYGVPQGSILSPLLFAIYMLPLGKIIQKHDLTYHCYADDTQLYMSFKPNTTDPIPKINTCLAELQEWMNENWLKLNADKTEVLAIGGQRLTAKQLQTQSVPLRDLRPC